MLTVRSSLLLLVIAASACKTDSPTPQKDSGKLATAKAETKAVAKAEPAPGPKFDANEAPTTAAPPSEPVAKSEPAPTGAIDPADPLGRKFADPAWFRKDMLEGAKAMNVSRSEKTAEGLFSSQILFEMPAGTTAEQCAEQLETKIGGDVKNLARSSDEKQPGRIKITGDTERYRVTLMCGEAKGVMRAYVSFEWLR